MDIQAFASAIAARDLHRTQAEVGVKVFRLALDAEAASAEALLASQAQIQGVGQSLNLVG